jgi:hypothetical protein
MKRFVVAAVTAVVVGLVGSEKADAQIVYNYSRPAPGGVVNGGTIIGPTASQTYSTYYSPFTGTMWGRSLYRNSFGQTYGRSYNYNPGFGVLNQTSNFYSPGFYFNPYSGGLGLNFVPGFGVGNTYQFYGGFYGRRW